MHIYLLGNRHKKLRLLVLCKHNQLVSLNLYTFKKLETNLNTAF